MKRVSVCLTCIIILSFAKSRAQDTMASGLTLKQCVDTAITNNLDVKQSDLQMQATSVNLQQAKANRLPDLFGSLSHGINQGRSIDPFTNSYINQQVGFANYNLNTSAILFNGFQLKNLVKQYKLSYEAEKMDLQQTKDNIMLNVILAYVQVLNNEDQLVQSENQAIVTRQQINRLDIMNQSGAISPALLYDLKGQLGNDELSIINSRNSLDAAKLSLAQLMNVPFNKSVRLDKINVDSLGLVYEGGDTRSIYEISAGRLALIKAAEWRRKSALAAVTVARSGYYPTIALSGSINTNFSSAAQQNIPLNIIDVASGDYVNVNGNKVPVMTQKTNFENTNIPYFNQFKNNYSTSLYVSVRVPILNAYRTRNRVALARIDEKNAEYSEQTIKTQLSQNIEQAYFSMTAAADRYKTLLQQVSDFSESFRIAEVRFNAGVLTQIDYLVAKNNVDRARINLIIAKYDYLFRAKILDYYRGALVL